MWTCIYHFDIVIWCANGEIKMRYIFIALGVVFFIIGVVGILTPIPFGIVFLTLSIVLLVPTVPRFARVVQGMRGRPNLLNRGLHGITRRAPMPYRRILRQTEPTDL